MTSNPKSDPRKLGPFSHDEVKALLMTIGVGIVLGFAIEMVDSALPKKYKMKALLEILMEGRQERKTTRRSSFDMEKPKVGFDVTE